MLPLGGVPGTALSAMLAVSCGCGCGGGRGKFAEDKPYIGASPSSLVFDYTTLLGDKQTS